MLHQGGQGAVLNTHAEEHLDAQADKNAAVTATTSTLTAGLAPILAPTVLGPRPPRPASHPPQEDGPPCEKPACDAPAVCVCLSGFKAGLAGYDLVKKAMLMSAAREMGISVYSGNGWSPVITHVIAPPGCRTFKVYLRTCDEHLRHL
jgi:hypothetical protein